MAKTKKLAPERPGPKDLDLDPNLEMVHAIQDNFLDHLKITRIIRAKLAQAGVVDEDASTKQVREALEKL